MILEALTLSWQANHMAETEALTTPIPEPYHDFLFQGLLPDNLDTAYRQITQGQGDAAFIQAHFQAQTPALKAL